MKKFFNGMGQEKKSFTESIIRHPEGESPKDLQTLESRFFALHARTKRCLTSSERVAQNDEGNKILKRVQDDSIVVVQNDAINKSVKTLFPYFPISFSLKKINNIKNLVPQCPSALELLKKKAAFTLAEVLITLGIIGVVAAMTIPVLFSNINNAKFRNQYKKAVSTLNQAGLTAQAHYEYNFAGTNALCGNDKTVAAAQNPEVTMSFCAIFNSTLQGKTYNGKVGDLQKMSNGKADGTYELKVRDVIKDDYKNYLSYSLADGTLIAFDPNAKNCELSIGNRLTQEMFSGPVNGNDLSHCLGFIDVNGVTLPNTEVRCTSGENRVGSGSGCIVTNNAGHLADVFPIVFHDATVEPASGAAQFILDSYK